MNMLDNKILRVVIFGAGNVATQLAKALTAHNFNILQVVSRSVANAKELAGIVNATFTVDINAVTLNADLYILAVPDSAIVSIANSLRGINGLVVHTSGSTPMQVLQPISSRVGVFYPFQTFTKGRDANLSNVPFCLEASSSNDLDLLTQLAKLLGGNPLEMNSNQRQMLHLAGVFSCNFVNHMLAIAQLLAQENNFDFKLLQPLIVETIEKALMGNPLKSQTGPAIRGDSETIKKHMGLLSHIDNDIRDLYLNISSSILNIKQANE